MLQKLVCENQTVTGKSQNNVAMIKNWFSSCYSFLMITLHTYSTFKMYGLMLSIFKNQTHNIKF